jgi:hypothetical protein
VTALVNDALDNTADSSDRIALFGDVSNEEARLLGLPPGYKRGLSRHSVLHIFNFHGDSKTKDLRGQIARIPETITKSNEAVHGGANGNVQTIRYYLDDRKPARPQWWM